MGGKTLTFTTKDLAGIAGSYNVDLSEAPVVVGHPKDNAPAFAWIKSLEVRGDKLIAFAEQIDPEFAELVKAGRYKKVSASLHMPGSAGNPKPGGYYLRHVGMLGGAAPAVRGLKNVSFAGADDAVTIEFSSDSNFIALQIASLLRRVREWIIEKEGIPAADKVVPGYEIDGLASSAQTTSFSQQPTIKDDDMNEADLKRREEELTAREKKQDARDVEFAAQQKASRKAGDEAFLDGMIKEGRLPKAEKSVILEFMGCLDLGVVSFSEGDGKVDRSPADQFRMILSTLPKPVVMGKVAENGAVDTGGAANFVAPQGFSVDPQSGELHSKATELQRKEPNLSYAEAVRRSS